MTSSPARGALLAARLISALWLGGGVFLILAAQAAFRVAPNPTAAADVVGAMLNRWHYIALAGPLALFALELRRARAWVMVVLFAAIVLAAGQAMCDLRIRTIRMSSGVPISSLPRTHPMRRQFGMLHGVSSLLLVGQVLMATAYVLRRDQPTGTALPSMSSS